MRKWYDRLSTGLIAGVISPPISFFLFCVIYFPDENVMEILKRYFDRNVLTHVISLSALINLPLFFTFLGFNCERSAQGVIGATILYGLLIVFLKFF
jgi:hypothetical protein